MHTAVRTFSAGVALVVAVALAGCSTERSSLGQNRSRSHQSDEIPETVKLTEPKPEKPTPQMMVDFGDFHRASKKYDLAEKLYRNALAEDSGLRSAYIGLARLHHDRGQWAEMQKVAQEGLAKHPHDPDLWNEAAVAYARTGDFRSADAAIRKALTQMPEHTLYLTNQAGILAAAGRYDESFAVYRRILPPAEAHYRVAGVLHHQGRFPEAIQRLRLALGADATHTAAATMLQQLSGTVVPAGYSIGETQSSTLRLNQSIPTETSPSSQRVAPEPTSMPTNGGNYDNGSRIGRDLQRKVPSNW